MNILVVCQHFYPEQFRINDICTELVRRGHHVTVITGLPNYPEGIIYAGYENKMDELVDGVHVLRCRIRPRKTGVFNLGLNYVSFSLLASKRIMELADRFDIVFVYQLSPVFMAVPGEKYAKNKKTPLFLYCCDLWPESICDVFHGTNSILYHIVKIISSRIYRRADRIGVKSPSFQNYLCETCNVNRDNIVYIPEYAEDTYLDIPLLHEPHRVLNFMFFGNIGKSQDCDKIVLAAAKVKQKEQFCIHFVGDGSMLKDLKTIVQENNLTDKVIFHGRHPIEDMPSFYQLADVCLLTLANESAIGLTAPSKLFGYMAAGKPILAAISGDSVKIIDDSKCGYYTDAGDVDGLSELMEYCIIHSDELNKLGASGRNYFIDHFSKKVVMDKFENEFINMIDML